MGFMPRCSMDLEGACMLSPALNCCKRELQVSFLKQRGHDKEGVYNTLPHTLFLVDSAYAVGDKYSSSVRGSFLSIL